MKPNKIYLIHATALAISPVIEVFNTLWPAVRLRNCLDDGLSGDISEEGKTAASMNERIHQLAAYAVDQGAEGILFTCSAFGTAIDAVKRAHPIPILKPNEAMIDEAIAYCQPLSGVRRIGLLTTFAPASPSMQKELQLAMANTRIQLHSTNADGAFAALNAGDKKTHDDAICDAAATMPACDVYLLGQFSMARAAEPLSQRLGAKILTSPGSAVRALQAALHN
jgi:Asp/Glu/hydantoin racemase